MKTSLTAEGLNDSRVEDIVALEASKELDDILDEVVNLAKLKVSEASLIGDPVAGREPEEEFNGETVEIDALELEIELPGEGIGSETERGAEKTKSMAVRLLDEESDDKVEQLSAVNAPNFEVTASDQEAESEGEDPILHPSKTTTSQDSDDQLATLLSKKIEKTITALFEERLSTVVENIIVHKINRILSSIR